MILALLFSVTLGFADDIAQILPVEPKGLEQCQLLLEPKRPAVVRRLPNPERVSSVELELYVLPELPEVLNLITTENGLVSGLLDQHPKRGQMPADLAAWFASQKPGQAPETVEWDSLPQEIRKKLLDWVGPSRGFGFYANRRVFGMKVKDKLELKFSKPTKFLGKQYKPGKHLVDVSSALGSVVEYPESGAIYDFTGIELHFMSRDSAGTASREAWILLDALGIPRNHQHVHIVAPLPIEKLKANLRLELTRMLDFWIRTNLMAEILGIRAGFGVTQKSEFFGTLTRDKIDHAFSAVAEGGYGSIGNGVKLALVGLRGGSTYTEQGLWGLEMRFIAATDDPVSNEFILDAIQYGMVTGDFGITDTQYERWFSHHSLNPHGNLSALIREQWYNQGRAPEITAAPAHIEKLLPSGFFSRPQWALAISKHAKEHEELAMLVHDWNGHVLFFEDLQAQERMARAQARALLRLDQGMDVGLVMPFFLNESGLEERVARSLGLL